MPAQKQTVAVEIGEQIVGILTGDIVSSSEIPGEMRRRLPYFLRSVAQNMRSRYGGAVRHPVDIFRGDSWQLVVVRPEQALRVALDVRCALYSLNPDHPIITRIGIGIGKADFIPKNAVSEGDGPAFRISGQALEEMDRNQRLAIRIAEPNESGECRALPVLATLMDTIAGRWTAKQSMAVSGALRALTQEQIGSAWKPNPITQQAVAQHLESAGWNAIHTGVDFFELAIGSMDNPRRPT